MLKKVCFFLHYWPQELKKKDLFFSSKNSSILIFNTVLCDLSGEASVHLKLTRENFSGKNSGFRILKLAIMITLQGTNMLQFWDKENHLQKCRLVGDVLVSSRVSIDTVALKADRMFREFFGYPKISMTLTMIMTGQPTPPYRNPPHPEIAGLFLGLMKTHWFP